MREWSVLCEWCDAKPGEPCVNLDGKPYHDQVHRPRDYLYRWEHGLRVPVGWKPASAVSDSIKGDEK
jgi:hypothetical protein